MATLEFGTTIKTAEEYIEEIYEVLGCEPPLNISVANGILKQVSVETEWKEGGTTPVEEEIDVEKVVEVPDVRVEQYEEEMIDDKGEKILLPDGSIAKETKTIEVPFLREEIIIEKEIRVVDYQENYEEKSLTQKQISDLNKYISDNIEQ